jgi:AraC-binding-like domain
MADLRFYAIHELDPLVAESAVRDADALVSPDLLHPPAGTYELDVHGFVCGPLSVEQAYCTDGSRVRLPADAGYVISFPVRGTMLAVHRGHEVDLVSGRAVVCQPLAEVMMTTDNDFDVLVMRVNAGALEDALEAQLGYPVRRGHCRLPRPSISAPERVEGGPRWSGASSTRPRRAGF